MRWTESTVMRTRATVVVLVAAIAAGPFSAGISSTNELPSVEMECGGLVTSSMKLANDLTGCPQGGLVIGADNIVLDLNGRTVGGTDGFQDGWGIRTDGFRNITIRNGKITGFDIGVVVEAAGQQLDSSRLGGGNVTLEDLEVEKNSGDPSTLQGDGILIAGSSDNIVKDSTIKGNGPFSGVSILALPNPQGFGIPRNNQILRNEVVDNNLPRSLTENIDTGIRIEGGVQGTSVEDNVVQGSGSDGILVSSTRSRAEFLVLNVFRQTVGAVFSEYAGPNTGTLISGNRVIQNGAGPNGSRPGDGIRIDYAGTPAGHRILENVVCANAGNGILADSQLAEITGNDVGAGIHDCAPNAGDDLHETASPPDTREDPVRTAVSKAPCPANAWRGNYTIEDTFNHPCTSFDSDADLSIDIAGPPGPQILGEPIALEATVRNGGPRKASLGTLEADLGSGLAYVSGGEEQGCTYAAPRLRCRLNTITAGDSATIPLRVVSTRAGSVQASFAVGSSAPDANNEDNAATFRTNVLSAAPTVSVGDVAVVEGNSGDSSADFNVSLSEALGNPVSVKYRTIEGTAGSEVDFLPIDKGALEFAPGETTRTVSVPVRGDAAHELEESFFLELFEGRGAQVNPRRGLGLILDDDIPLSVRDASAVEGDDGVRRARFSVELAREPALPVSVDYETVGETARPPLDFGSSSGRISFGMGEATRTTTVDVLGDLEPEPDEYFRVDLANPHNAALGTGRGRVTILNDDTPVVTALRTSAPEGNGPNVELLMRRAEFRISLSKAVSEPVTVEFATVESPPQTLSPGVQAATAGEDYRPRTGTVTFGPGETEKVEPVLIVGDDRDEYDEQFSLKLMASDKGQINPALAHGTIIDDDIGSPPGISAVGTPGRRGCGGVFVSGHTPEGSAWAESDSAVQGSDSIGNPKGSRNVWLQSVRYVTHDKPNPRLLYVTDLDASLRFSRFGLVRGHLDTLGVSRTFGDVDLGSASVTVENPRLRNTRTVDFKEYDAVIVASADYGGHLTQEELDVLNARKSDLAEFVRSGGGIVAFQEQGQADLPGRPWRDPFGFLPSAVHPVNKNVYQTYAGELKVTPAGRAIGLTDADVNGNNYYQWFPATSGWEVVDIDTQSAHIEDAAQQGYPDESRDGLPVSLGTRNPIGCRLSADHVALHEGDGGTKSFVFRVNLAGAEPQPLTVQYSTQDAGARQGEDYDPVSGSFTLAPGETSKTVSVQVNGDTTIEQDETFLLRLAFSLNQESAEVLASATILNDDALRDARDGSGSGNLDANAAAFTPRQDQVPGQEPGAASRQQDESTLRPPSNQGAQVQSQPQPHHQAEVQAQPQSQAQTESQGQMQTRAASQMQSAAAPMIEAVSQAERRVEQVKEPERRDSRERNSRNDAYRATARSANPETTVAVRAWFTVSIGAVLGLSLSRRVTRPPAPVRFAFPRGGAGPRPKNRRPRDRK